MSVFLNFCNKTQVGSATAQVLGSGTLMVYIYKLICWQKRGHLLGNAPPLPPRRHHPVRSGACCGGGHPFLRLSRLVSSSPPTRKLPTSSSAPTYEPTESLPASIASRSPTGRSADGPTSGGPGPPPQSHTRCRTGQPTAA